MIEFVNIKTGERRQLTRAHQIGAFINSSDLHQNSAKGQDFGWRLSEEIIVKIDEMSQDVELLDKIATRTGISIEDITPIQLVQYLSTQDDIAQKAVERQAERTPEFKKPYEAKIAELKQRKAAPAKVVTPVIPVVAPVAKKK